MGKTNNMLERGEGRAKCPYFLKSFLFLKKLGREEVASVWDLTCTALWSQRINAAVRALGLTYSVFMNELHKSNIEVDRKVFADLAMNQPESFKALVEQVQKAALILFYKFFIKARYF